MRTLIAVISMALIVFPVFGAQPAATSKKTTKTAAVHKATAHKTTAHKTTAHKSVHRPTAHKTTHANATTRKTPPRKTSTRRTTRRRVVRHTAQQQPTLDRYKEIQQALADKGFYKGDVNGTWGPDSVDALKRFQREQNIPDDGKIGSLALIALGLGPRRGVQPSGQQPPSAAADPSSPSQATQQPQQQ